MPKRLDQAARRAGRSLAPEFLLGSLDFLSQQRRRFLPRLRPGPARTLDVGCGGGNWSLLAWRRGNRITGVDTNDANLAEAARLVRIWQAPASEVEFRRLDAKALAELDATFDQAMCFEVIEHIRDDKAVLRGIYSRLKAGGRLLLSVPNSERRYLYGEYLDEQEQGGHVRWGYGHDELAGLLKEAGFQSVEVIGYGRCLTQWATEVARRLASRPAIPAALVFLALYPITWLDDLTRCPPFSWFAFAEKP